MPHLPREHFRVALRRPSLLLLAGSLLFAQSDAKSHVTAVRFWTLGEVTRVAIETDGQFEVLSDHLSDPERIFFDITGTRPALSGGKTMTVITVGDKLIQQIRVAESRKNVTRVVLDLQGVADVNTSRLENPNRLIIEVSQPGHVRTAPPVPELAAAAAEPPSVQKPTAKRTFIPPPAAKAESPNKRAQVALLAPPAPEMRIEPGNGIGRSVIAQPLTNTFLPPVVLAAKPNVGAPVTVERAPLAQNIDLKHLPDPNTPETGPHAYPTPHGSANNRSVDAPKTEPSEFAAKRVASVTAGPEATLVANHGADVSADDKPAISKRTASTAGDTALPAKRNTTGDRSMIRVLGLKVGRIVLDAGHGGHDTGTVGPEGLREKDLVLDVTKRLGALIEDRMGIEVVYTRSDDIFVPLERRTEIANEAKADLFLSIHANSSTVRTAAGVETYYLSFTTSKTALDLAARENAASNETVYDLQDILQKIALNDKVDESRDFAARVQTALFALAAKNNKNSKDRGIRKAPFIVLIGANMPSVLAEIGFISNAHDESTMKRGEYRERIAEALYKGVSQYAGTLSHFQVAQRRSGASE